MREQNLIESKGVPEKPPLAARSRRFKFNAATEQGAGVDCKVKACSTTCLAGANLTGMRSRHLRPVMRPAHEAFL